MKQLSGIDATFLYLETKETPMHVAGLTLYEPPADMETSFHEHFKSFFAGRVHLIPIFRKKLAKTVFQLDHPGWVDAGDPDFDYHILGHRLQAPGSFQQLEDYIAKLHAEPLDRSKPLWQFTVIEGLEDGRVALYSKVHHAAIDGGAGMVITQALYDLSAVPRTVDEPEPVVSERKPTIPERTVLGLHDLATNAIRQQWKIAEAVPAVMSKMLDLAANAVSNPGSLGLPQIMAPKTPFGGTIGRERSYAARSISLIEAKKISKASGAKINDIVMAVCSGALRAYLQEKHQLPDAPLVAFVPISVREAGNTDLNNQVFGMNVSLATNYGNALRRLKKIQQESGVSKDISGSIKDAAPKDFTLIGAPTLLPGIMQLYGKTKLADILPNAVNVTISNTAGPPFPMYCAGATVTSLYPVSIPIHGVGLNFTVQSYMDKLDFGLTAGRSAVPDIHILADFLVEAFEELREVTGIAAEAKAETQAQSDPASDGKKEESKPAANGADKPSTRRSSKPKARRSTKTDADPKPKAPSKRKPTIRRSKPRRAKSAAK